jgi:hypothetical protein
MDIKKTYLTLTTILLLSFNGCTPASVEPNHSPIRKTITEYAQPTPHKYALYQKSMKSIAAGIKHDPKYRRIALNTPQKKAWFKMLTYRLWDRQITRYEFMSQGLAQYPSHRYEFSFIINGFEDICSTS